MISKILTAAAVSLALTAPVVSQANTKLLTGDARLACEAILCLSTGSPPSECRPALKKYFSIKLKRAHKTLAARKNFLKLCPSSDGTDNSAMIESVVHGRGR
ncbi:TrbM/KikA/MpfK family conjugal transfer protein [Neisseria sp.]|uniref:TrbM/KikA/MpfK family conjugal transfer protein n=1 Tax=Neisseria sp. TaxID=192066 RepID=UPI0035A015B0